MIRLPMCKVNIEQEAALFLKDSSGAISWNLKKKKHTGANFSLPCTLTSCILLKIRFRIGIRSSVQYKSVLLQFQLTLYQYKFFLMLQKNRESSLNVFIFNSTALGIPHVLPNQLRIWLKQHRLWGGKKGRICKLRLVLQTWGGVEGKSMYQICSHSASMRLNYLLLK